MVITILWIDCVEKVNAVTVVDKVYKFSPRLVEGFRVASLWCQVCTFCKEAPSAMAGSSLFITGNPNLIRDAVVKHIESTRHSRCPDFYINRTQSQPNNPGTVEAEIGAVLCSLNVITLFISLNFALVNWCCCCVQFLQADNCSKQKPIVLLHFLTWGHECSWKKVKNPPLSLK